jgi:ferredoxin
MAIHKVWIQDGCISCCLCSDIAPEVFRVPEGEVCVVVPDAPDWFQRKAEIIKQAAEDCPVEVIKLEEG